MYRTKIMEGRLWYCDEEGIWYKYPFDLEYETEKETQENIGKLLRGEDIDVEPQFDID